MAAVMRRLKLWVVAERAWGETRFAGTNGRLCCTASAGQSDMLRDWQQDPVQLENMQCAYGYVLEYAPVCARLGEKQSMSSPQATWKVVDVDGGEAGHLVPDHGQADEALRGIPRPSPQGCIARCFNSSLSNAPRPGIPPPPLPNLSPRICICICTSPRPPRPRCCAAERSLAVLGAGPAAP